jgi:hypothetical protein
VVNGRVTRGTTMPTVPSPGLALATFFAGRWNVLEHKGGVVRQSDRDCLEGQLRATAWAVVRDERTGRWVVSCRTAA